MRIGYFVETPVEKNLTGGARSFLDLLEQLIDMGVTPFVVVSEPWQLTDRLEEMGVSYITSKMYRPFVGIEIKAKFYHLKYYLKLVVNGVAKNRAYQFFKKNNVQLIHINSQFCGVVGAQVAKKLKVPYVYHIREFLNRHFGVEFYNQKQADKLIGGANAIVAISESIKNYELEQYPFANIVRIYNGLNFQKIGCKENIKRFTAEKTRLVIVGRVCKGKNQWDAIHALEILIHQYNCQVELLVVGYMGTDPYEKELSDYVKDQQLTENVHFIPFSDDPYEIMRKCDIGLICSEAEAFGRVTIEYKMAGLLGIGSGTGGTPELIHDGEDGFLYELKNPEQLAEKINWAITHPDRANQIIQNGKKQAVELFSIQSTAKNMLNLYKHFV